MDLKGVSWVKHMYRRCETLLLEAEDDVFQDVVNYVENQVQAVGDGVKKLYSDVILDQDVVNYVENQVQAIGDGVKKLYSDVVQDLLPPTSAPEGSDVPAETYIDACAKDVHINVDAERVIPNLNAINVEVENHGLNSVNFSTASSLANSINGSVKECSGRASEICPCLHKSHEASCGKMAVTVSGCDGVEDVSKRESDVSVDDPSFRKGMFLRSIDNKVIKVTVNPCSEDESDKDKIDDNNVIGLDLKTIERPDHFKLEESCVVVNGDELRCVPLSKGRGKSKSREYKEKIRDALSLRLKSAREEEYKQLAVLHADNGGSLKPDITMKNTRILPTNDIGESEWEFL